MSHEPNETESMSSGLRSRVGGVARFGRTVAGLSPSQVANRLRLRGQRAVLGKLGDAGLDRLALPVPTDPGWPEAMVALDSLLDHSYPGAVANAEGRFEFLGRPFDLSSQTAVAGSAARSTDEWDWRPEEMSQLWRYHLHYFEWAWSFAARPDQGWARPAFARLVEQWRAGTLPGRWDEWSPYVVSLRVWNLCGVFGALVADGPQADAVARDIAVAAGFLRRNLETDVGGNHLIKNLKGLIGAGVFLDNAKLVDRVALPRLAAQVELQVLADGGHFERSPSYHGQVLGDLIDIHNLLVTSGRAAPEWLGDAISRMQTWLRAMIHPDGEIAMFNDATALGPARLDALLHHPPAKDMQQVSDTRFTSLTAADGRSGELSELGDVDDPAPPGADMKRVSDTRFTFRTPAPRPAVVALIESGYVVQRPAQDWYVVVDVGAPGPRDLPAHIHADALSLEMSLAGRRFIVDTGTSSYDPGPRRPIERSTAAHNTVVVDGEDQSEVWGLFRAGRLADVFLEELVETDDSTRLVASHTGYRHLDGEPIHRRTITTTPATMVVCDEVLGSGIHQVELRWHFAPEVELSIEGEPATGVRHPLQVIVDGTKITISGEGRTRVIRPGDRDEVRVATAFGETKPTHALAWSTDSALPVKVVTTFSR